MTTMTRVMRYDATDREFHCGDCENLCTPPEGDDPLAPWTCSGPEPHTEAKPLARSIPMSTLARLNDYTPRGANKRLLAEWRAHHPDA